MTLPKCPQAFPKGVLSNRGKPCLKGNISDEVLAKLVKLCANGESAIEVVSKLILAGPCDTVTEVGEQFELCLACGPPETPKNTVSQCGCGQQRLVEMSKKSTEFANIEMRSDAVVVRKLPRRERMRWGQQSAASKAKRAGRMAAAVSLPLAVVANLDSMRERALSRGFKVPRIRFHDVKLKKTQDGRVVQLMKEMQAHAQDMGETLTVEECVALHWLNNETDLKGFVDKHPAMEQLCKAWQQQAVNDAEIALSMSGDEALHMKDKMMVSYAAWDIMRKMSHANEVWPGAHALKILAKEYNAHLTDMLGLNLMANDKTGYRVDIRKLHEHILRQQVLKGMPSYDIPRLIKYKLSLDGSNMGQREVELVAITPINLADNAQVRDVQRKKK